MLCGKRNQSLLRPRTSKCFLTVFLAFYLKNFCLSYDEEFCRESRATMAEVQTCPATKSMWDAKALKKNCSSFSHNCSGVLSYHCLINPWQNKTIEVCAPRTKIGFGFCAEYNALGGRIQDSYTHKCSSCKNNYWSTDAYKYTECYEAVYRHRTKNASRYETLTFNHLVNGADSTTACLKLYVIFLYVYLLGTV
ncbi:uncharacterized protein LOC133176441 [Saccostrea echinata]|uniref:uncharacterized protein LOC133176441 n=1 Tax=Saccostrea echinata TaxID=191078 RepID=UPI002A7EA6E9|nr:uncharacterized protein LOC133176441 [Saccostrea echinata]